MANVKNNASTQETRRRLLVAAGEVFAEKGLHAATTKEITDRAGVNMAAVNYHYQDKFELYSAVIRHIVDEAPQLLPHPADSGSPADRLRAYVRALMHIVLTRDVPAWKLILISRELAQPTASFEYMMERFTAPLLDQLRPIIRDLLGPDASTDDIELHVASVVGQCFYYPHHREMIARVQPSLSQFAARNPQHVADHITDVVLNGCLRTHHAAGTPLRQMIEE